jgi:hypothetical protein
LLQTATQPLYELREVFNAVRYLFRNGVPWNANRHGVKDLDYHKVGM